MARVLGIDLGTTNSCVAIFDDKKPEVIANPNAERTTPSVVCLSTPDKVVVGVAAKRQAVTSPEHTIFGIKRLIGRKVNTDDVDRFADTAPFAIVAAKNGDAWVRTPGRDISPQEISAYVLETMRRHAETYFGEPITQAVITVPAYFDDAQRQATKDAGRIAGLDVRRILNEPTAAALAYGASSDTDRTLVVFDLGGGTFDLSILHVSQGLYEVLAVSGDMMLGGDDFDRLLVEQLIADIEKEHGINLHDDPTALGRLKEAAETTKRTLSAQETSTVLLPFLATEPKTINLEREVKRDELEQLVQPLLQRLRGPCERALADANLAAADIDEVLLVGGMTRMPAVQAEVEKIFSRKPSKGANPDEVVALGAALHGGILQGKISDSVLLDVTPKSIGIRVGKDRFSVVIPRNTTLPARASRTFATARDDQAFVTVELFQGDSEVIKDNRLLGRLRLDGLPKGKAGSVRVALLFFVDVDGILDVVAREMSTGQQTSLRVSPSGGLSEEEFEKIIEQRRRAAQQ